MVRGGKSSFRVTHVALLAQSAFAGWVHSAEFTLGDAQVKINATATYGIAVRADHRDPTLIPPASAAAIGLTGRAPAGQNADDGNLNFDRGDRVSTVLKAVGSIEIQYGNLGARARAKVWHDFTLGERNVPWGNLPSGYAANAPLSDRGFDPLARFSGAALMDASVHGDFALGARRLFVKLGKQTIPWGVPGTIRGGLDQVNAYDIPAISRPGAVAEESEIPALSAFSRLSLSDRLNLEAFYQFKFEPNQIPGCGTFNSHADYAAHGCDKVVVGPFDDRTALAAGLFATRAADRNPSDHGQYGLGLTYLAENLGRLGIYYASIHSRGWVPSALKSTRIGLPPLIPGDPGGGNVQYFIEYPEDVRIFGANFLTRLPDRTALFAELTYQPNHPVRLNGNDLLNAFASNTAPTPLRADATATAPGAAYHGFDRLRVTHLKVGGVRPLGKLPGVGELTLAAEAGFKHVHQLPDPAIRRYGRADPFGVGPVNGACSGTATQCSNDGYVTAFSWGYRLRLSALIPGVADNLDFKPSLSFGHDVKGWSHDDAFSEKRRAAILALRAEYRKRYFGEVSWTAIWGGSYNVAKDRDVFTASIGAVF